MLHHVSIAVTDLQRAASFYDAALGALGFARSWSFESAVGYGLPGGGDKLAIKVSEPDMPLPPAQFHLAFAAPDREAVRDFYRTGLSNGGRDNGKPGLRPKYGPEYYAAYLFDPDGYNIEAVIKDPVDTETDTQHRA